jgi:hypothetical protein
MTLTITHNHYLHSSGQDQTVALLNQLLTGQGKLMATMDDVVNDIKGFQKEVTDYIAGRDAVDADLKAKLDAALAAGAGAATQAQVDEAFAAAEAAKALIAPPVVVVAPV